MPRVTKLDDKKRARLIELVSGGEWLADALKTIGVTKHTLYRAWAEDSAFKTKLKDAVAFGIQFRIDAAMDRCLNATDKDKSIIARHVMEAAEKRAKLLAPSVYNPKDQPSTILPGSQGMLMIRWVTDPAANTERNQQVIDEQPEPKPIEDAA